MDIFSIILSPAYGTAVASYRPITFAVLADTVCPYDQPMYCDVYINTTAASWYYKTITQYPSPSSGGVGFVFDIQDALQEAIKTFIPTLPCNSWVNSNPDSTRTSNVVCFCRFRGSSYVDGLLAPNGPIPIQATATTAAVDGGGTMSDPFNVLNGSILPSLQNVYGNNLLGVLALKHNTTPTVNPNYKIYTLSNLPRTDLFTPYEELSKCATVYKDDYGQLPIYVYEYAASGMLPSGSRNCKVYIWWQVNGVGAITDVLLIDTVTIAAGTYYLPLGLKDIATLAPSVIASLVNPNNNAYFHIAVLDVDANQYCYVSPKYKVGIRALERKRLWFLNTYGHFEQVTFVRNEASVVTTSSDQLVPYTNNGNAVQTVGHRRFNVRAHDELTITGTFAEAVMPWLSELFMSPFALMEDIDALSGNPTLTQYEVVDGSLKTKKTVSNNRTFYDVSIKLRAGIDYITLRN